MTDACSLFPYSPECDHLAPLHLAEFERLDRAIRSGGGFRLIIAQYNLPHYRDRLLQRLTLLHAPSPTLNADRESLPDFAAILSRLKAMAANAAAVHLTGLENWLADPVTQWLPSFNYQRETLARECPVPLILWAPGRLIRLIALHAPDMWAWRAGVFDFSIRVEVEAPKHVMAQSDFLADPERDRRRRRIADLKAYLTAHPDLSAGLRASMTAEAGSIHEAIGDPDEAMQCFEEALSLYRSLGDDINIAEIMGQIADILHDRGELDEALRIRREEQLPVFERLGDVRSRAVTIGKIADILHARGELDEALRIRREEELPVYERLGDVRGLLITRAKIGMALMGLSPPRREEAARWLCLALSDARRMRIPEADIIQTIIRRNHLTC